MEQTKKCLKCGRELPATLEYFYKHDKQGNLTALCKECKRAERRAADAKNKERRKESARKFKEAHEGYFEEYQKKYQKDYQKKYRAENAAVLREKFNRWCRESDYYARNKEKLKIKYARKRQRKYNLPATLTAEEWESAKNTFNEACAYCGCKEKLTQDHFIPVVSGGGYTKQNIIPACTRCNSSKGKKEFSEWYSKQEYFNQKRKDRIIEYINAQ